MAAICLGLNVLIKHDKSEHCPSLALMFIITYMSSSEIW